MDINGSYRELTHLTVLHILNRHKAPTLNLTSEMNFLCQLARRSECSNIFFDLRNEFLVPNYL